MSMTICILNRRTTVEIITFSEKRWGGGGGGAGKYWVSQKNVYKVNQAQLEIDKVDQSM